MGFPHHPLLAVSLASALVLAGCLSVSWSPGGPGEDLGPVSIHDAVLVRTPPGENSRIPFDPEAAVGDEMTVVVRGVGPFAPDPDGKEHAVLELTVRDSPGEVVRRDSANVTFDRTTMPAFQIPWSTTGLEPQEHRVAVEVTDPVAGDSDAISIDVTLRESVERQDAFGAMGWTYLLDRDGTRYVNPSAAFPVGRDVHMGLVDVGPFTADENGHHRAEVMIEVRNASGEEVATKSRELGGNEEPDAEGYYALVAGWVNLGSERGPGEYTATFTVRDEATGEIVRTQMGFTIVEERAGG